VKSTKIIADKCYDEQRPTYYTQSCVATTK